MGKLQMMSNWIFQQSCIYFKAKFELISSQSLQSIEQIQ